MKKRLWIIPAILLMVFLAACTRKSSQEIDPVDQRMIGQAISAIENLWREEYKATGSPTKLKIVNTQILWVGENSNEYLSDVACIVEFDIHSNAYSEDEAYLYNCGYNDSVVFYRDGTHKAMPRALLDSIRTYTYSTEHLECIETVVDYGGAFNQELSLAP